MIVVFAAEAEADLERVGDFIAQDNPRRAVSFVTELVERCLQLADIPEGFPLVPRHAQSGIRRRPYGSYLIFYRVRGERIEILHVLSGARDWESLLFPD
ncbi:type II toxin-antitoxin system RelE/ParE family toxin [Methylorubrum thiocyanatum]|jgi:toxin ParE1/3/4|uniref:type II toxin-antitoxin system RelE/ParE family toxin n=1 Tax=Methylorubrum thiocyanatum TaxID=47958 RepID=UPI0035C81ED5